MSTQAHWRKVDRILQGALDLSGTARERYLADACGDDPTLRCEVEDLLAIDRDALPVLDNPRWEALADLPGHAGGAAPGQQFGRYRILERIGEGGMGTVFLAARDDGQYERGVAIKVLKQGTLTASSLGRFRNECRVLARLEHEGIARLYDAGSTPDGLPFLVMEHIAGVSLDRDLEQQPRDLLTRLVLFRDICAAVSHAHQQLIVHRDLKPSNILVTPEGKPMLLDFGIAKVLHTDAESSEEGARDWTIGRAPMTPRYASPEQVAGGVVGTTADVFALGLILGELILGAPMVADTAADDSAPSGPARASLLAALAQARVATDLCSIVRMATMADPAERYPSAEQLSAEVGRFLDGQPVMARPQTRRYRLRRFVGRHKLALGAAAGLFGLVLLAAISFALLARELAQQRDRARVERRISDQVTDFMVDLFAQNEPGSRDTIEPTASEMLSRGAERIRGLFADDASSEAARVHGALLGAIGRAYHELSRYDRAQTVMTEELSLARATLPDGAPALVEALLRLAATEAERSNLETAENLAREALAMLPPDAEPSAREGPEWLDAGGEVSARHPLALRAWAQRTLGDALVRRGDLDSAEPLLEAAAETDRSLFGAQSEQAALSYGALAGLAFERRDAVASEIHCKRALEAFRHTLGSEHPRTLEVLGDLAIALQNQGKLDEAEVAYRNLLARQIQVFGPEHDMVAQTLNSLGTTYYDQEDFEAAATEFRASLEIFRTLTREPTLEVAGVINNLARTLREAGKTAEATPLYREALDIFRLHLDPRSPSLGAPLTFLGGALCSEGEGGAATEAAVAEGEALLDEARTIYLAAFGADHYRMGLLDATRSRCLVRRGRVADARRVLAQALATGRVALRRRSSPRPQDACRDREACRRGARRVRHGDRIEQRVSSALRNPLAPVGDACSGGSLMASRRRVVESNGEIRMRNKCAISVAVIGALVLVLAADLAAGADTEQRQREAKISAAQSANATDLLTVESPDQPIARYDGGTVTRGEYASWLRYIRRDADPERLSQRVAAIALHEVWAAEARAAGLHESADVRMTLFDFENRLLHEKLRQHLAAAIDLSKAELDAAVEARKADFVRPRRVRLYNILRRYPAGTDESTVAAVREEVEAIRARIADGEAFKDVARAESVSQTRFRDGLIGWVRPGQLAPEMETIALALDPGAMSAVLPTEDGFTILWCEEVDAEARPPVAEIRAKVEKSLRKEKFDARWQTIIDSAEGITLDLAAARGDREGAVVAVLPTGRQLTVAEVDGLVRKRGLGLRAAAVPEKRLAEMLRNVLEQAVAAEAARRVSPEPLNRGAEVREQLRWSALTALSTALVKERLAARFVPLTQEEIRAYYDQHRHQYKRPPQTHLEVIMLVVADRASLRERSRAAEALEADIRSGRVDFAAAARAHSDHGSAARGGDVGWLDRGRIAGMGPNVVKTVETLGVGEMSGLVQQPEGLSGRSHLWLVRKVGSRPSKLLSFEEAARAAENGLGNERTRALQGEMRQKAIDRINLRPADTSE